MGDKMYFIPGKPQAPTELQMRTAVIKLIFATNCPYCGTEHRHRTTIANGKWVQCSNCDNNYTATKQIPSDHSLEDLSISRDLPSELATGTAPAPKASLPLQTIPRKPRSDKGKGRPSKGKRS
jgi:ssDNA-binding Zn-finger/Zn-ribbon topoisomerase 1